VLTSARVSGQFLYMGGVERPRGADEGQPWRHALDAHATVAVTPALRLIGHVDGGREDGDLGASHWLAGALYARHELPHALAVALRGDAIREWRGDGGASPILIPADWMASATATLTYAPAPGLTLALELRHDHADREVFFGGEVSGDGATTPYVPNRAAQDTVTVGVTAWR
jgi:hypothetical protein